MKGSKQKTLVIFLIILTINIYIIRVSNAKYTSTKTIETEVRVAKWAVNVAGTDITTSNTITLTLTPEANNNVVTGKIAPGVRATGTIIVDPSDAEVSMEYWFVVANTKLVDNNGDEITNPGIELGNAVVRVGENVCDSSHKAQIEVGGNPQTATVSVIWTNNEAKNPKDTAVGIQAGAKVQVTLIAYAQQKD